MGANKKMESRCIFRPCMEGVKERKKECEYQAAKFVNHGESGKTQNNGRK